MINTIKTKRSTVYIGLAGYWPSLRWVEFAMGRDVQLPKVPGFDLSKSVHE